jgi:methionyl-tRNA formyltransferase
MNRPSDTPRFAFFGTPEFSVRILEILETHGLDPVLIITAPDKPRGRKLIKTPTPVKKWALERGTPFRTPETLKNSKAFLSELKAFDLDVSVVAAYGLILPESALSAARLGAINVHPSLLPKYRGASPIESQILADEKETGVTIIKMDALMDHGPILSSAAIKIPRAVPDAIELEKTLAHLGGELLSETLVAYVRGGVKEKEQDHAKATYTKKISKDDALIDPSLGTRENFLKIQAYKRFKPHFFTEKDGKKTRVVITRASFDAKRGALIIERVIPEGGKEMPFSALQ